MFFFFFQAEDGIRDWSVTGVQTCALPISAATRTLISSVDLNRHRVAYVVAVTVTMLVFAAAFLYPLWWMATSALKTPVEFAQPVPSFLPESWHPENYATAWTNMRIGKFFLNTVYYAVGGWLIQV